MRKTIVSNLACINVVLGGGILYRGAVELVEAFAMEFSVIHSDVRFSKQGVRILAV